MKIVSHTQNALRCISGSWTICSLSDGHVDLPSKLLQASKAFQDVEGDSANDRIRLSVNCFLLQHEDDSPILIDCGAGGSWDDTMGHLGVAFDQVGIDPDDIRTLVFTHAHNDHINGLVNRSGNDAFRNLARILIPQDAMTTFEADESLMHFHPLLQLIGEEDQPVPGVDAVPLPGHAAGHTGYRVDTGDDLILICGDIVHVPARQFARPELTWAFDENQALALETRLRTLQEASDSGLWLAGAHLGRPGIGRVVHEGKGYRFEEIGQSA